MSVMRVSGSRAAAVYRVTLILTMLGGSRCCDAAICFKLSTKAKSRASFSLCLALAFVAVSIGAPRTMSMRRNGSTSERLMMVSS